jgi:putative MFS transporter
VVDDIGFGYFQWRAVLLGGGIWAADGAELLLIGSITSALSADWHLSGTQRGMVVTLVFVGVLVGNALSGVVGDKYGRRLPILVSYACIFVFSLLSALSWDVWSLGFCRIFVGVAFGLGQPAWNTMGTEISPCDSRVVVNGVSQLLFVLGEMYSAGLVWSEDPQLQDLNWRRLLILGAIPSLIFGILSYFFLIESPKYLASSGRTLEARAALEVIRSTNGAPAEVSLDFDETPANSSQGKGFLYQMGVVWGSRMWFTTSVVCYSTFTLNFIYYGGIYSFPQVLPSLHLRMSPGANLFLGAFFEIPGFLLGLWIASRTTRKITLEIYLVLSFLSIGLFLYGAGMSASLEDTGETHAWAIQAGFLGIKAFVNVGFIVVYLYASEVYPTVARTTGTAACLATGRLGAMACPLVYEHLSEHTGGFHTFFVTIAALTVANSILVCFLTIETAGKKLEDGDPSEREPLKADL